MHLANAQGILVLSLVAPQSEAPINPLSPMPRGLCAGGRSINLRSQGGEGKVQLQRKGGMIAGVYLLECEKSGWRVAHANCV